MTDSNMTGRPTLSRRKRWLFGAVLAILLFGVLEIGARIGLRITRGFDGKHLYQYVFDPYKNILPAPNFVDRRGIRHNAQGFRRSTDVSREKPAGTYRIFLMGASTAYGLGGLWPNIQRDFQILDNSETIDAYLERILSDSLPGVQVEVINAAITSTWTHHNLIYLNQTILGYHPDMILSLDGYNDFYHYRDGFDQFGSYSYNLPSRVILGDPTIYALVYGSGWWLFRKSAFAHVVSRAGRVVKELMTRHVEPPLDVERALAGHRKVFPANALKMLERIGLILQAEHVETVFMLQPMLALERDRVGAPEIERRLFEFNIASYRENYESFLRQAVAFVRTEERAMAERVGAQFIDLTNIFGGVEGQVYTDYAHLTPLGNETVARYVTPSLLPRIRHALAQQIADAAADDHP